MDSSQFVIFISIVAAGLAKGKSEEEINILSTFFSQLGDTLAIILAFNASCNSKNSENNYEEEWLIKKILCDKM